MLAPSPCEYTRTSPTHARSPRFAGLPLVTIPRMRLEMAYIKGNLCIVELNP